jgi:hypothetical protein
VLDYIGAQVGSTSPTGIGGRLCVFGNLRDFLPPPSAQMASRFLATAARHNLKRRALKGVSHTFEYFLIFMRLKNEVQASLARYATATSVSSPMTEISTLSNGLTIATETHPNTHTATVGVWIDAGSRAETDATNGAAHFLEHMAFKGTNRRTQHALELEVENLGAHLNAYTSREQTVYYAKSFKKDIPVAVDIISDILQNSKLEPGAIERERDVILREQEEVDKQLEEVVFDHLHSVAFQGISHFRTFDGEIDYLFQDNR